MCQLLIYQRVTSSTKPPGWTVWQLSLDRKVTGRDSTSGAVISPYFCVVDWKSLGRWWRVIQNDRGSGPWGPATSCGCSGCHGGVGFRQLSSPSDPGAAGRCRRHTGSISFCVEGETCHREYEEVYQWPSSPYFAHTTTCHKRSVSALQSWRMTHINKWSDACIDLLTTVHTTKKIQACLLTHDSSILVLSANCSLYPHCLTNQENLLLGKKKKISEDRHDSSTAIARPLWPKFCCWCLCLFQSILLINTITI